MSPARSQNYCARPQPSSRACKRHLRGRKTLSRARGRYLRARRGHAQDCERGCVAADGFCGRADAYRGRADCICVSTPGGCENVDSICVLAGSICADAGRSCGFANEARAPAGCRRASAENSCNCAKAVVESARPRHLRTTHTHTRSCPSRRTNPRVAASTCRPSPGASQNLNRPTKRSDQL